MIAKKKLCQKQLTLSRSDNKKDISAFELSLTQKLNDQDRTKLYSLAIKLDTSFFILEGQVYSYSHSIVNSFSEAIIYLQNKKVSINSIKDSLAQIGFDKSIVASNIENIYTKAACNQNRDIGQENPSLVKEISNKISCYYLSKEAFNIIITVLFFLVLESRKYLTQKNRNRLKELNLIEHHFIGLPPDFAGLRIFNEKDDGPNYRDTNISPNMR